jgi:hypothetical protein
MSSDQLSEIRPAVREAIEGSPDMCVTLELDGDPARWVQVKDFYLNAAYPRATDPIEALKGLPDLGDIRLANWEPMRFATFEVDEIRLSSAAEWIDAYFVHVLGCAEGDYHLNTSFEKQ